MQHQVYQCEFCGATLRALLLARAHEAECPHNPAARGCYTCANMENSNSPLGVGHNCLSTSYLTGGNSWDCPNVTMCMDWSLGYIGKHK